MSAKPTGGENMNSKLAEKTLTTELKCAGRVFNTIHDTVLLPNGNTAQREVAEHRGGVCIAALTEQNELLFVRQFRYPYKEVVLELPAGKLEDGDTPLQNGKRELLE
jgi:ADP-ribose pyrophosphatase